MQHRIVITNRDNCSSRKVKKSSRKAAQDSGTGTTWTLVRLFRPMKPAKPEPDYLTAEGSGTKN